MDGNVRYVANAPEKNDYVAERAANVDAQHPFAALLSCADSRVGPEIIFDEGLGDIFVVRVAGNFADDDGLASLEYAVEHLGVPLVLVLGHSYCGAVQAAIKVVTEHAELPGHEPKLVEAIRPAVIAAQARHPNDLIAAAVEENVRLNVKRLTEDRPILAEALGSGKLGIQGGVYDLGTGKVALL
jgi:carbonic anhydrase